jgi:ADP-dependent NAD(P)H-hydrate dehydratase
MAEHISSLPALEPRADDSHKGNYGHVLVIAGSRRMSGAAVLCGSAALRAGAGLVTVAVPEGAHVQVAAANPCYLTEPMPQDLQGSFAVDAVDRLLELAGTCDVVAFGPGIGKSATLSRLAATLVKEVEKPLIVDADGLNALVGQIKTLEDRWGPLILTPHPGEFARLLGVDVAAVQDGRETLAVEFAAVHAALVVLKGHGTIVTDGRQVYVNDTGNPGMASGGTGDVLTGVIAALLAQGMDAFAAAQLGVFLHGRAGDLAMESKGGVCVPATEVIDFLDAAFRSLHTSS